MREIKFRAWDKVHECYLYDVQNAYDMLSGCVKDENGEDASYDEECFAGFLDNDKYVVEQYTGLHDKNGLEIYEGDIVKNEYGKVMEVNYDPRSAAFGVGDYYFGTIGSGKILEVIGNIFENQELMEAAKHE